MTADLYELVRLAADERKVLVAAMLNPPSPSARLKKAAEEYRAKLQNATWRFSIDECVTANYSQSYRRNGIDG